MLKRIFLLLIAILFLFSGCSNFTDTNKIDEKTTEEEPVEEVSVSDKNNNGHKIIYFEIGVDEKSTHFEHRVAKIYSINPDGSKKTLIYSDIYNKYDLGRVYNISPDGKKIACSFFEGGRGAYRSLSVIYIETGKVDNIVKFDYTEGEMPENIEEIYGNPIWAPDSNKIAYEIIYIPIGDPISGNYRTDWIHVFDIEEGKDKQIIPKIGGMCASQITFMQPVIYLPNGDIYAVFHPYYEILEGDEIIDYYTKNETLYLLNSDTKNLKEIMDIKEFKGKGVEEITSFSNFKLKGENIIFELLGDFEEDGDIYMYLNDSGEVKKLTKNDKLREQQPDVFKDKVCYVGAQRYGTITYQNPSGDLYLLEGAEPTKLTGQGIGVNKLLFSPDGNSIAYNFYNYDSNFEYVESTDIYNFSLETNKETKLVDGKNKIISLVGWLNTDN